MTAQQCGILDRQAYTHTDCAFHGHMIKNSLRVVSSVLHSGLYCHAAEKHGRGDVWRMRGGWLEAQGQYRTSSMCLARNDKGWLCCLPRHAFSACVTHFIFTGMQLVGIFDSDCSLGEGDVPAHLPLDGSLIARPNRA